MSYFHLAFLFCVMSVQSESLLQAILHAAKLPVTTLPRFCYSRETEGANDNDHPSYRWHASVGGWLKCYFHSSFQNCQIILKFSYYLALMNFHLPLAL